MFIDNILRIYINKENSGYDSFLLTISICSNHAVVQHRDTRIDQFVQPTTVGKLMYNNSRATPYN